MRTFRNMRAAWKGSSAFGRALKMESRDDELGALDMVHKGLSALSKPGVDRFTPHTSSVLIRLTQMCEHLAHKHNVVGASKSDLEDTHINITRIYGDTGQEHADLLRYIEGKLGYVPRK